MTMALISISHLGFFHSQSWSPQVEVRGENETQAARPVVRGDAETGGMGLAVKGHSSSGDSGPGLVNPGQSVLGVSMAPTE